LLTLIVALVVYIGLLHKKHAQWDYINDSLFSANQLLQQKLSQQDRTMRQRIQAEMTRMRAQFKAFAEINSQRNPVEQPDEPAAAPASPEWHSMPFNSIIATRRWFQFRLRTLLAVVTILCVMLAFPAATSSPRSFLLVIFVSLWSNASLRTFAVQRPWRRLQVNPRRSKTLFHSALYAATADQKHPRMIAGNAWAVPRVHPFVRVTIVPSWLNAVVCHSLGPPVPTC
jgi:hypothetical protein